MDRLELGAREPPDDWRMIVAVDIGDQVGQEIGDHVIRWRYELRSARVVGRAADPVWNLSWLAHEELWTLAGEQGAVAADGGRPCSAPTSRSCCVTTLSRLTIITSAASQF
jgi:hypothetical protein